MPNTQYSSFIILFVLGEVSRNIVTEVNFLEWNDAEDNGRMWRMYASKVYETYTSNDVQTNVTYSAWLRLQIVCSLMKCAHILRFTMIKIRFFGPQVFKSFRCLRSYEPTQMYNQRERRNIDLLTKLCINSWKCWLFHLMCVWFYTFSRIMDLYPVTVCVVVVILYSLLRTRNLIKSVSHLFSQRNDRHMKSMDWAKASI